ncbi:MAG: hypothetical protein ACP5N3_06325 [Candidatus Nanoarchaeia archaeon]
MHFKRTNGKTEQELIYAGYRAEFENPDLDADLKHLNALDLSDAEVEFLQMKKARNKRHFHAPDPRLGDYET